MAKAKVRENKDATEAFHLAHEDGKQHIVGVKALHVLLTKDGDGWFAQGLEIDYAATGSSIDEVKENFAHGLALTVHEHLTIFGDIEKILVMAPQETWKEYLAATPESLREGYSTVQLHEVTPDGQSMLQGQKIPFEQIQFVTPPVTGIAHGTRAAEGKSVTG